MMTISRGDEELVDEETNAESGTEGLVGGCRQRKSLGGCRSGRLVDVNGEKKMKTKKERT